MAVPDLRGELTIGGSQVDITGDLYARDGITHTRGRASRKSAADPAACAVTIKNVDGKYTPRNPMSPYYGQLGRNTPFQLSLGGAEPYLATTSSNTSSVGSSTPDTAVLDITGDIDIRLEATLSNWMASGSVELCGKGTLAGSQRSWLLMMRDGKLHFEWSTAGTSTVEVNSTALLPAWTGRRMAVRVTFDVNNGASGNTTTFYYADSIAGPWTQLGAPVVNSGITSIFNGTAPVMAGNGWPDLAFPGPNGMVHALEVRNGIGGTVVANPVFSAQTPGATSFTDGAGRTWTVGAASSISDRITRCALEVPEWPPKWAPSESDAWTPIEAAGILRRMGQGQKSLQSTLRRAIPGYKPLAYWPMEEGRAATQASSPLPLRVVKPLTLSPANWAAVDTLPSSSPLPTIDSGGGAVCQLGGRVPAPATAITAWSVRFLYRLDTPNTVQRTVLRILSTGGTVAEWYIQHLSTDNSSNIIAKDDDGVTVFTQGITLPTSLYGQWYVIDLQVKQNGANVDWHIGYIAAASGSAVGIDFSFAGTAGRPTAVASPPNGYASELDGMALGHITVWGEASNAAFSGALTAWAGETAGARMLRLSAEENVPLTIIGDPADTELVGPQRPLPLMDLLREAADADGGIFGEAPDRRELVYRTRANMYNQAPTLTLDYALGSVAPPFEPVEDDQIRNDWEVIRVNGSSGFATLDEGPLSVQDPPNGIGLYDDSVALNLATDDQADRVAGWLLHITSWDEARYPQVTVRLHHSPELVPQVLALGVGDKIRITGLPVRFASGNTVELLVDGWTERFGPNLWEITYNCSPAGPWTVGVTDDAVLGKVDTDGSELASSATSTATTLSVAVTDGPLWTPDPAETPWDIKVGGEVMTVTTVGTVINSNPYFDTNTAGWTGQAATISRDTTNLPPDKDAAGVLFIAPDGVSASGGANSTRSATGTVTAGASYVASMWCRFAGGWSDVRPCVDWYDAAGVFLSSSLGVAFSVAAGVWTPLQQTFTAPASASSAVMRARHGGTPSGATTWRAWAVRLVPVTSYSASPQTMTVVRSVNGVVKAQSAGTGVRLAQPSIVAL